MAKRKTSQREPKTRRNVLGFAVVFAIAFVDRLIVALQLDALPISRHPQYDALEYLGWARRVAAGDFTWPVAPPHGPGYPYFLGAVLAATGGSVLAARIVQALLGALTCVLVARIGARWFDASGAPHPALRSAQRHPLPASRGEGSPSGLAAGLVLAIYAPLVWIDVSILAEGLLIFLTAAAVWSVATNRHPAISGALLGLAALVRPTALLLLPLFLVAAAKTWRMRAVLVVATCAVIAPVTIANWRTSHALIPIQSFGGMNAYLGNSPLRDGLASARPGGDWDRVESDAVRRGAKSVDEEERDFARKTRAEIAQHPLAFAALLGKKLVWTFQAEEIRDTSSFYFFAENVPLLRWLPGFMVLFAIAAAGALSVDWRGAPARHAAALVALTAAANVVLVAGARYRMPMALGLALFAGAGIVRAWEVRRAPKQIAILAAIAIVAGGATRIWRHAPSHNFAEELAFSAESLGQDKEFAAAERTARQSIDADRNNALAWDALGVVLAMAGRRAEGRDALQHATALNPDYELARLHLGTTLAAMGDETGAARELAAAAELSPHDPRPVQFLAPILAKRGDLAGAQRYYARLVELSPGNAGAMMTLARIDGALGKAEEGLAAAQRAAAIREPEPEEWMVIALLAAHAGKVDTASDALQRAGAAANSPQGIFIAALVRYRAGRIDEAAQILDELLARAPGFEEAARLRAQIAAGKN